MKKLIISILFSIALVSSLFAQTSIKATVTWKLPTTYTDGRPLPVGTQMGFNIYRGESITSVSKLNSTPVSGTTYLDTTPQPNKTYFYSVATVNLANNIEGPKSTPPVQFNTSVISSPDPISISVTVEVP